MGKNTRWDKEAAIRVRSATVKNPDAPSARDRLDREARSRADRYTSQRQEDEDNRPPWR
ncbi:hypothetical protein [Planomonospora sp. ID82291]|uniref:hypothetical protein n=1 Tax=Planomonospora sp. ID82291 TaxID=2738136 RepID=UPI0018C368FE|nr:hypothetical protein [Planomonospora sp. ID82291]MBG0818393.1 hypothetical protein [Planomonospora sp. ID82291]